MDKSNHGQVGEALYLKFTSEKLKQRVNGKYDFTDGQVISIEELEKLGVFTSVPLHIDNGTQGEYECVCEHGVEIY